jgi:iron(III) transport system permease protein
MFIISLGLKNIDRNLIDVARLTGKKFLGKILIPLVKPHIIISFFFIFAFSISEYTTPSFLRINTYQAELFTQLAAFFNLERAVIYSLPLIILTFLFSASIYLYFKNISFATITSFSRKKEEFIILSKKSKILLYIYISILISLSLIIPSLMMFIEAGKEFTESLATAKAQFISSLILSSISAFSITILGILAYYFLRKNLALLTIFMLPLGISSPVIGIALINLYSKLALPIYGTILMVPLGFILRFLPFSIFISSSFLPQISYSLEEYSRICKTSFLKKIQKIILPLSKGAILSSFVIIFILCLGEVGVTQMVSPPGFQTLSMRIETLMHYGNYSKVASLSLILLLLIFMFYLIYVNLYEKEIYRS